MYKLSTKWWVWGFPILRSSCSWAKMGHEPLLRTTTECTVQLPAAHAPCNPWFRLRVIVVVPERSFPPQVKDDTTISGDDTKAAPCYVFVHHGSEIALKFLSPSGQNHKMCNKILLWICVCLNLLFSPWHVKWLIRTSWHKINITHILWLALYYKYSYIIRVFYNSPCFASSASPLLVGSVDSHCQRMNQHLGPATAPGLFMLHITFRWSWIPQWP